MNLRRRYNLLYTYCIIRRGNHRTHEATVGQIFKSNILLTDCQHITGTSETIKIRLITKRESLSRTIQKGFSELKPHIIYPNGAKVTLRLLSDLFRPGQTRTRDQLIELFYSNLKSAIMEVDAAIAINAHNYGVYLKYDEICNELAKSIKDYNMLKEQLRFLSAVKMLAIDLIDRPLGSRFKTLKEISSFNNIPTMTLRTKVLETLRFYLKFVVTDPDERAKINFTSYRDLLLWVAKYKEAGIIKIIGTVGQASDNAQHIVDKLISNKTEYENRYFKGTYQHRGHRFTPHRLKKEREKLRRLMSLSRRYETKPNSE